MSKNYSNLKYFKDEVRGRTLHHAGARELAKMYNSGKRIQEWICVTICTILIIFNGILLILELHLENLYKVLMSVVWGMLASDFASGFVHWTADTWGSVDLPVVGKHLLRGFREHHIDPTSITRHDFIETNGDNFAVGIPLLAYLAIFLRTSKNAQIQASISWVSFIYSFSLLVVMTNQIHKWAHTYIPLPRVVEVLQKYHIILPRLQHRFHHISPHETYYCITTGWLNWPLELLRFWPRLEEIIEKGTGCKPRVDDMLWARKGNDRGCHFESGALDILWPGNWPAPALDSIRFWHRLEEVIEKKTGTKPRVDDLMWTRKGS